MKPGTAIPLAIAAFVLASGCAGRARSGLATFPAEPVAPYGPAAPVAPSGPAAPVEVYGPAAPAETSAAAPVYHPLERGQTLYALSRLYEVSLDELLEVNSIVDPRSVAEGTPIYIPRASRALPYPTPSAPHEASLGWPLSGPITGRFGRRGQRSHHSGVDIDGERGDPIHAAADGRVLLAGPGGPYGRMIILEHAGGLQTVYAHASRLLVTRGQRVQAGDRIAEVGSTGNARGSHLHFEVRRDGRPIDPLPLLRGQISEASSR